MNCNYRSAKYETVTHNKIILGTSVKKNCVLHYKVITSECKESNQTRRRHGQAQNLDLELGSGYASRFYQLDQSLPLIKSVLDNILPEDGDLTCGIPFAVGGP